MGTVSTVAAVIAAVAALITVVYARRTVLDGRAGHRELMAERKRAAEAEAAVRRLAQAGRIACVLTDIARVAREEALSPPGPGPGTQRATFLPTAQAQLRAALAVFYALGGPALPGADALAGLVISLNTQPVDVLKLAAEGLGDITRMASG